MLATPASAQAGTDGLAALADQIKQLGGRAIALTGDVADAADVEAVVATAVAELGQVDILVNNARRSARKRPGALLAGAGAGL